MKTLPFLSLLALTPFFLLNTAAESPLERMKEMETKVKALVEKSTPATVALVGRGGSGSGVIVNKEGLILTAAHVMSTAETMTVVFPDGKRVPAKVLGGDYNRDIGMVQITEGGDYPFVKIGDSDKLEPTTIVVTLGHPGGFDARRSPPIRIGRAYNNGKTSKFIRSDCTLIGGDSGGPLFNLDGELVGIHSSIGESLIVNNHAPVAVAVKEWERMKSGEQWGRANRQPKPDDPVLGLVLNRESTGGVRVDSVFPESPGAKAGLKAGDLITSFKGQKVTSYDSLTKILFRQKPNTTVKVKVKRDDETIEADVKLARRADFYDGRERDRGPAPDDRPRRPDMEEDDDDKKPEESTEPGYLGAGFTAGDDGLTITRIVPGTAAEKAKLQVGDIVVQLEGKPVGELADFANQLQSKKAGNSVKLKLRRDGKDVEVTVTLGKRP